MRACSRVGCTNSDVVTISTAQLPPTFVASPTTTVMGWYLDFKYKHLFLDILENFILLQTIKVINTKAFQSYF